MNNYHYVRNTHPQLFWLDFISNASDLKALEDANYGRYWQSVRDGEPVQLSFDREFVLVAQPPFRGRQSITATAGRQAGSQAGKALLVARSGAVLAGYNWMRNPNLAHRRATDRYR